MKLVFTEPVEVRASIFKVYPLEADDDPLRLRAQAARLVDEVLQVRGDENRRADDGLVPAGHESAEIQIVLPDDLPPGPYVVMWRVLSVDAHYVGHYVFTYAPAETESRPMARGRARTRLAPSASFGLGESYMPYPWIKAIHFIGLALLLGGPVFWHLIRKGDEERPGPSSALGWGVFAAGFVLFLVSGYLDAVRAARDLWGELLPGDMYYFLTESRYGIIVTRKSILTVAFALLAVLRPARPWGGRFWRCWASGSCTMSASHRTRRPKASSDSSPTWPMSSAWPSGWRARPLRRIEVAVVGRRRGTSIRRDAAQLGGDGAALFMDRTDVRRTHRLVGRLHGVSPHLRHHRGDGHAVRLGAAAQNFGVGCFAHPGPLIISTSSRNWRRAKTRCRSCAASAG